MEARYNGAAGITLRSSDLNGEGLVGETRRAALKHRGLLEPRKGAGPWIGKLGGTTDTQRFVLKFTGRRCFILFGGAFYVRYHRF